MPKDIILSNDLFNSDFTQSLITETYRNKALPLHEGNTVPNVKKISIKKIPSIFLGYLAALHGLHQMQLHKIQKNQNYVNLQFDLDCSTGTWDLWTYLMNSKKHYDYLINGNFEKLEITNCHFRLKLQYLTIPKQSLSK